MPLQENEIFIGPAISCINHVDGPFSVPSLGRNDLQP
jgi:hypothetical protein